MSQLQVPRQLNHKANFSTSPIVQAPVTLTVKFLVVKMKFFLAKAIIQNQNFLFLKAISMISLNAAILIAFVMLQLLH